MKYQFSSGYKYFITYSLLPSAGFFFDSVIKEIILNALNSKKGLIDIEAFSILNNHLHLMLNIADFEQQTIKNFLKEFTTCSSRLINQHLNKSGANWEHYFGWGIFNEKAYMNILAYILGNPIRHGIVKSFDELYAYPFCNFNKFSDELGREAAENLVLTVLKIKDQNNEKEFFRNLSGD